MSRQVWFLVGGNGAGKSTFYELLLKPRGIAFLNADLVAKTERPDAPEAFSYEAARITMARLEDWINRGRSFCYETVFSHPSKLELLKQCKALGYECIVVYIHIDSDDLNVLRVQERKARGGHGVPEDKIRSRIPRTLDQVRKAGEIADELRLLNNSSRENPFIRVADKKKSKVSLFQEPLPVWAQTVLFPGIASSESKNSGDGG